MKQEVVILVCDDDPGHSALIKKNLKRAGISNRIIHFTDGQQILNFLFKMGDGPHRENDIAYLLICDIRMPKVNGVEVLKRIKESEVLAKMPVIMLTTTDDPREIEKCHLLGCSNYIAKPVDYNMFVDAIRNLGLFLLVIEVPNINDSDPE